ncbi:MAG: thioredoxin fold domain-containing protein [Desulfobacter sp.]|nr:MAG: thioredoxin fold domain-containing protein [Desulfobacter sp.]
MRKENVLVAVLIVMIAGGIYGYNANKSKETARPEHASQTRQAVFEGSAPVQAATGQEIQTGGIQWKDFTPGMARAREENKSIFLYFHAPWCTYCTKLKKTTFRDAKVQSYLNENFVSISVNTDVNQALAQEWRVRGLPTMWFLAPDGKKINQMPGFVEAGQLLKILEYIHTKSYTTMDFREFMKNG